MDVRPIRSEADYDWALAEIEIYFSNQPEPDSPEADRFDVISALITDYEDRYWPIDAPEPIAAIRHWMELHGYVQNDLAIVLGSRSRASELLNCKRPLNMSMAHLLRRHWHIPAEVLLRPAAESLAA